MMGAGKGSRGPWPSEIWGCKVIIMKPKEIEQNREKQCKKGVAPLLAA